MTVGIYVLTIGSYAYIGQSINVERRVRGHVNRLSIGTHRNKFMQNVYNKYKEVRGYLLEECEQDKLNKLENLYIRKNREESTIRLMNMTDGGDGTPGFRHSKVSREKMSKAHRGKVVSIRARFHMSMASRGRAKTEEHKRKISEAQLGISRPWLAGVEFSADRRNKISSGLKEYYANHQYESTKRCTKGIMSDVQRQRMSEGMKKSIERRKLAGEYHSPSISEETKQKLSEAAKKAWKQRHESHDSN